jgi:hypothetical protein
MMTMSLNQRQAQQCADFMAYDLRTYGPAAVEYEPPTRRPTWRTFVQYRANEALYLLEGWQMARLMDADYLALCDQSHEALMMCQPDAKALGCAVQAARDALRDMARDDVKTFALAGLQAVREILRR